MLREDDVLSTVSHCRDPELQRWTLVRSSYGRDVPGGVLGGTVTCPVALPGTVTRESQNAPGFSDRPPAAKACSVRRSR